MSSYQTVDIYVEDTKGSPVEGMMVRVLSEDGTDLYTQGTTDSAGLLSITLFTNTYSLRFYKYRTSVKQPVQITVTEGPNGQAPAVPNTFDIVAEVLVPPLATNPRLCRASGYFLDVTGAPHPNLDIKFSGTFAPILLEGSGVLASKRSIRTDKNGFACVDLIRCAIYLVMVEGYEDILREVRVPDAPSVNLPDLLFPVVSSVSLSPDGPYTLSEGDTLELTPTVLSSDSVPLIGTATGDVKWSLSDTTVASLAVQGETLLITAKAVGTTSLLVERLNTSIIRVPESDIEGSGTLITVV